MTFSSLVGCALLALATIGIVSLAMYEFHFGRQRQLSLIVTKPWKFIGGSAILIVLIAFMMTAAMDNNGSVALDFIVPLVIADFAAFLFLVVEAFFLAKAKESAEKVVEPERR